MNTSVFERNLTLRVAGCSCCYSLLAYNGTGGVSPRQGRCPKCVS